MKTKSLFPGKILRYWRIESDLSREHVAEKLSVSVMTVARMEKGTKSADFDQIIIMCDLYQREPSELFAIVRKKQDSL